ncbi:MAG: hypothetical protein IJ141_03315 [Lachnospiraceae bacterium]|nr:hypothetical protein [Lachnospiraceae bacterium]
MKKEEYKNKVFEITMKALTKALSHSRNKGNIKITYANGKRDIDFRRYNQGLSIKIDEGGNIKLCFYEFCHDDIIINYKDYYENETIQKEDLAEYKTVAEALINDFINDKIEWYIAMDFMSDKSVDWKVAYERARG